MKMNLGFVLGLFLVGQYAVAGDATKSEAMEDATEQQGSIEQFEQTLQDSPTAAGLVEMEDKGQGAADQAQEAFETVEDADMLQEEPMPEVTQP